LEIEGDNGDLVVINNDKVRVYTDMIAAKKKVEANNLKVMEIQRNSNDRMKGTITDI
jgi:hypothetical protein